ncbi:Arl13L, Arl13-like protein [Monocercomonoides exilis]|uniref:Arl13L, Arl13-like protein n=1 Tax=Monocercomonoides exilis TaxID=2049356 RepID=UPI003559411C|nr:Arl13L, Arl13-like protein [Monocercomonoides exilis]|eukprot:MONOS_5948.1-p1 / transcript=MONOS_5948.1 / gene=MONOS_5948 / organism=Monocercomonoides_exilis_PA203 / gene_product=Arl13L, Arl13-like protein / transcript_product=Arl13L, Arl13-like protein / location=Mono_scaffold00180:6528-8120(+) / protein_length=493 / sequence_SO=supercontig / SO=protein_coding / is_pseudo=false
MGCCASENNQQSYDHHTKEITILLLGLDNAGKSSVLNAFKGNFLETKPTWGYNFTKIMFDDFIIKLTDVGGGKNIRAIWPNYFFAADGVMFIMDSTDDERFDEVKDTIFSLFKEQYILGKPMLFCANKRDIKGSLPLEVIYSRLSLEDLQLSSELFQMLPTFALRKSCSVLAQNSSNEKCVVSKQIHPSPFSSLQTKTPGQTPLFQSDYGSSSDDMSFNAATNSRGHSPLSLTIANYSQHTPTEYTASMGVSANASEVESAEHQQVLSSLSDPLATPEPIVRGLFPSPVHPSAQNASFVHVKSTESTVASSSLRSSSFEKSANNKAVGENGDACQCKGAEESDVCLSTPQSSSSQTSVAAAPTETPQTEERKKQSIETFEGNDEGVCGMACSDEIDAASTPFPDTMRFTSSAFSSYTTLYSSISDEDAFQSEAKKADGERCKPNDMDEMLWQGMKWLVGAIASKMERSGKGEEGERGERGEGNGVNGKRSTE